RPRHMTPDELTELTIRARTKFYRYVSIAKRALNFQSNTHSFQHLGLFLSANLVSRREISSKLGRPLGGSDPIGGSEVLGSRGSGVPGFSGRGSWRSDIPEQNSGAKHLGTSEPQNPGTQNAVG